MRSQEKLMLPRLCVSAAGLKVKTVSIDRYQTECMIGILDNTHRRKKFGLNVLKRLKGSYLLEELITKTIIYHLFEVEVEFHSRDRNMKDDKKRTRTRNAFATTANLDYRVVPKMVNPMNARNSTAARGACFESNHFKAACPRLNQTQRPGGRPNQVVAIDGVKVVGTMEIGHVKERSYWGGRGGSLGPEHHASTFTLNNHYATTLFDSGADYSLGSTAFTPLLGIVSSNLGFSYEIEIASGQLVEIDKVIRGCELEIEGHTFNIDLIPFGSGSFDVIIGMDWLSKHKVEIIFHEKVVRIPLQNGKTLRVIRERPEEKARHLRSAKAKEKKKEDIVVVRNFPEEKAFQTLKDKLCNAPVLALLNGPEDFMVYCDASSLGLGCVLMQRELFRYHPGKANVVADALSRKERIKAKRIRAMNMTLHSSIKDKILVAQKEASD
ncbi:putative reverse transcriptase domain-containing protein [Tanacetum coccineum]